MTVPLATHTFTRADIQTFARDSGDTNPIHVDPVAARRLVAGDVVVHGMAGLLWALEAHFTGTIETPARITAFFRRPLIPGLAVQAHRTTEDGATRLSIQQQGEETASILLRGRSWPITAPLPDALPPLGTAKPHRFAELKHGSGALAVSAESTALRRLYPHAVARLGPLPVAAFMALSRLVGMECPGLHSLYAGLDLTLDAGQRLPELQWRVSRHSVPIAPIRMDIAGAGIAATVDAFVRPEPVAQPGIAEVAQVVGPRQCQGQRAVIIGGSRGLGELVAKIIAAGGGESVLTYRSGSDDAGRVVSEIAAWGGKAESLHADTAETDSLAEALVNIAPTHLYYFATPHITARQSLVMDDALLASYTRIYADDFERLMTAIAPRLPHTLRVFYPSTVFIDEQPRHFAEYIHAKIEGEKRCRLLQDTFANLEIMIARLPRMHTDQTASLVPVSLSTAVHEMARVVLQMSSLSSDKDPQPHAR